MFWSKTPEQARADDVRTGRVVPTRAERQQCWAARDTYFACLDKSSLIDVRPGTADAPRAATLCAAETKNFETDCAAQWVKYFREWRVADYQKRKKIEQLEREGAVKMDVTPQFGGAASGGGLSREQVQNAAQTRKS